MCRYAIYHELYHAILYDMMLYFVPYQIIPYYTVPCHAFHTILYHTIAQKLTVPYNPISQYTIPHRTMTHNTITDRTKAQHCTPYHTMTLISKCLHHSLFTYVWIINTSDNRLGSIQNQKRCKVRCVTCHNNHCESSPHHTK